MAENPRLDRIDVNILAQLQADSGMTNVRLADAVGLSPSPCLQRVKRLEKAGFIESYRAQINIRKLAESVMVFTEVTLADHRREDFQKFEREIRKIENLQEMHLISGGYDYLLKFTVRNMLHYQEIILDVLEKNIGVAKYFSYIVIQTLLDRGYVPLKSLIRENR
ncbi:Leucine-responsive regulatory protein [Paracoccus haematequi]|uniref:Leucine-responsive regulatory protein n=1 Tax=Paracoccus haematequi TaxID=2491866 RepID=A0A3S4CJF3_9RHOB|nr:winged helix-turn-helix transcriptional regulator [Paracoccus haematequi]VDS09013.1 Leucine-responsive regulatory protein [Paracoccus haematequi]